MSYRRDERKSSRGKSEGKREESRKNSMGRAVAGTSRNGSTGAGAGGSRPDLSTTIGGAGRHEAPFCDSGAGSFINHRSPAPPVFPERIPLLSEQAESALPGLIFCVCLGVAFVTYCIAAWLGWVA